jgi:SAM-dependent methyltransferase
MIILKDYLAFGWQLINGWRVNIEYTLASWRERDIEPYIKNGSINILDLANGSLRPQYSILKSKYNNVYGIDLVNRPVRNISDYAYSLARYFYNRQIDDPLNKNSYNSRLVCGDVHSLPFSNNTFDLITSIAAFEHFSQVPFVVSEVHRITQNGGLIWAYIHPFTCPSGGHNVNVMEIPLKSIPNGIEPWDHLRKRNIPFHVPLNEWRIKQYLKEFSRFFEIVNHYCAMQEGEHFLTSEIETELSDYTRDELTCRGYIIVARKSLLN